VSEPAVAEVVRQGVLRFSYGVMGSGKSTVALQVHHNLIRRGLRGVLCTLFDREGTSVSSRLGVSHPAVEVTSDIDLLELARAEARAGDGHLDFLVCDEVQFYAEEQIDQLAAVVDEMGADVFAYGLLTDFRGRLFDGTRRLMEVADERVPLSVETRCWCGRRATHNARLVNGVMTREGETVVIADTEAVGTSTETPLFGDVVSYELLCRRHYVSGVVK
jgi:thymidine kinase